MTTTPNTTPDLTPGLDAAETDTVATAASVAAAFSALYGSAPEGVWSAPGRVNLIGEHTDYNEGYVLPFAIDRRTFLALAPRQDRSIRISSAFSDDIVVIDIDDLSPESLSGWSAYPLGVAWALGNITSIAGATSGTGVDDRLGADLATVTGVDVYLDSTVPIGAGLSSSAAIESAMALALNDVWQLARPADARQGRPARREQGRRCAHRDYGPVRFPARSPRQRRVPRLPQPRLRDR